jgi:hypothetical protein
MHGVVVSKINNEIESVYIFELCVRKMKEPIFLSYTGLDLNIYLMPRTIGSLKAKQLA